jgi:copper chaperone CopZ
MKKLNLTGVLLLLTIITNAQFNRAELKVNGLTCSMCSYATEKQLNTIDFIDSIGNDLDHTTYILYFKKDADINSDLIKSKVEDAGFSIGSLIYTANFTNLKIENNYHLTYKSTLYHFMNVKSVTLNGDVRLKLIDKGFVSDKEFKRYRKMAEKYPCYQTGKMPDADKVYHLTLI